MRRILVLVGTLALVTAPPALAANYKPWGSDTPARGANLPKLHVYSGLLPQPVARAVPRLTVLGAKPKRLPDGFYQPSAAVNAWSIAFTTKAPTVAITLLGPGARYRVRVDSAVTPISTLPIGARTLYIRFRKPRQRTIALETEGSMTVKDVSVARRESVHPLARVGRRILFLGDSFTEGDGGSADFTSYADWAAHKLGLIDVWTLGVHGSGYIARGDGPTPSPFSSRVAEVCSAHPADVIVAGGINDAPPAASVGAAATSLYASIRRCLPHARLVPIGPWPHGAQTVPTPIDTAIAAAASAAHLSFVDPIADAWFTAANVGKYLSSDQLHPNPAGHKYLGGRVASALAHDGIG